MANRTTSPESIRPREWLRDRGYDGVIGMEHGISQSGIEGEKALIAAYRSVDVQG
jgi:hypothetical protein